MVIQIAAVAARVASLAKKAGKAAKAKARQAIIKKLQPKQQKPKKIKPKWIFYMEPHEQARLVHDVQLEMMENIKKQLRKDDKNFTYTLSESVGTGFDGEHYTVEVKAPYGHFVEYGIPPGNRINFDALYMWVQYKLGVLDPQLAKTVTFKVFNKIINEGIPPSHFFKKSILKFRQKNKLRAQAAKRVAKKPSVKKRLKRAMKKTRKILKKANRLISKMAKKGNKYT